MMRGEIWLESWEGQGSAFHFTGWFGLASQSLPAAAAAPPQWLGLPILVVDDNLASQRILKETLESWGLNPTLADSGLAAFVELDRALDQGQPLRLALLDARMPAMDGFTVAERIMASRHAATVIVFMLSSSGLAADLDRCQQLGIAICLSKPIKQSELFD